MASALQRARAAFDRQAWREARAAFVEAAGSARLEPADHERHAIASYLTGADEACEQAWSDAHRTALDAGNAGEAARCAVLLALCLVLRGQTARAGGWLARAERILADADADADVAGGGLAAAAGYVAVPRMVGALEGGDHARGLELATQVGETGRRAGDRDLATLGVLGEGQALIGLGDTAAGVAKLDEAMVAVTAGEVGPVITGITYCAVIVECLRLHDLARASEWTHALAGWCDGQPDLVPYRGQCLVHRSQLQQLSGEWLAARATAAAAADRLTDPPHPALGLALYQQAELHRLTGELEDAEAAYRAASGHGHDPMPGLALLELARGDVGAAAASIRRALRETALHLDRPALLAAAVDIFRLAGDVGGASDAADELVDLAERSPTPVLAAMAAQASGAVLVAQGDLVPALDSLRDAVRGWQELRMPYDAARAAMLIGLACAALGDRSAAALEFSNAREVFTRLGARPDLQRLASLGAAAAGSDDASASEGASRLSEREREVLSLLAAGRTNREIAEVLLISPHTVRRHVEHIFAKLGVSSRAAATARGYELGLL